MHPYIPRQHRMHGPHGGMLDCDTMKQHPFGTEEVNEDWPSAGPAIRGFKLCAAIIELLNWTLSLLDFLNCFLVFDYDLIRLVCNIGDHSFFNSQITTNSFTNVSL